MPLRNTLLLIALYLTDHPASADATTSNLATSASAAAPYPGPAHRRRDLAFVLSISDATIPRYSPSVVDSYDRLVCPSAPRL
ncbi:hypothetical protein DFH09DRAFT_1333169 [Mycena vulgaris]|nr:hypothetical protein DFH09DRAFT_1333169 [Mycena vulgaris]